MGRLPDGPDHAAAYKKANLAEEQVAKVKACCLIAAKDLAAFTGDDRKDKQGEPRCRNA